MAWLRRPQQERPRTKVATGLAILSEAYSELGLDFQAIESLLNDDNEPWCEESLLHLNLGLLRARQILRDAIDETIAMEQQE